MYSTIITRTAATLKRWSLTTILYIEAACILPAIVAAAAGVPLILLWTALRVVASMPLWAVNALRCALIPGDVPRWRIDLAQIRRDFAGTKNTVIQIDLNTCQQHGSMN